MNAALRGRPEVQIVTPALAAANNGNAHTAARWQRFLAPVSACRIGQAWDKRPADLLVALHAGRSATSIAAFRAAHAERPIVVVLTGTDLYGDLGGDVGMAHSLECASAIVVLQEEGLGQVPEAQRAKAVTIVQSAPAMRRRAARGDAVFVAVGHLRAEKDPLTLMAAARLAPALRIDHIGGALDEALGHAARDATHGGTGYRWLGALAHAETRRRIGAARALVHASRLEGGANVVIEAVRAGVPVLASRIDGNVGLLGRDYDGYFPPGDAAGLARLMQRFAGDAAFALHLGAQCMAKAPLYAPAVERAAVRALAARLLARQVEHSPLHPAAGADITLPPAR